MTKELSRAAAACTHGTGMRHVWRWLENMTTDEMKAALERAGFVVGKRDPRLNTDFAGKYMVAEAYEESELPTKDGSNGPWCIVGDDLGGLIQEAYETNSV